MRACDKHLVRALNEDPVTMRQFGISGKTFEQQSREISDALDLHTLLSVFETDGTRLAHHLLDAAEPVAVAHDIRGPLEARRCSALTWISSALSPCPGAPRETSELSPALWKFYDVLFPTVSFERSDREWKDQLTCEYGSIAFAKALQRCARAVLRSPVEGVDRLRWVVLSRQAHELKKVCREMLDLYDSLNGEYVEEESEDGDGDEDEEEVAAWVDLHGAELDEYNAEQREAFDRWTEETRAYEADDDDDEAVDDETVDEADNEPVEGGEAREGQVPPQQAPLGLAAFAADHQNVHTGASVSGATQVIGLLASPSVAEAFTKTYSDVFGSTKRLRAFQEYIDTDEPVLVRIPYRGVRRIDFKEELITYKELVDAAWALCTQDLENVDVLVLDIISAIHEGYCNTTIARMNAMAEVLCDWTSLPSGTSPLKTWATHRQQVLHSKLLYDIHGVWVEVLLRSEDPPQAVGDVMEPEVWSEFKLDVSRVRNFGISYATLLNQIWAYAVAQPTEMRQEIALRLAEEILDGRGMCEQGKMTRLTNVLRGFHPALDDVVVLSVGEQLQNRMAVIGAMPADERLPAAAAVFAELAIPTVEQGPWLEALAD